MTDRSFERANDDSRNRLTRLVETLIPSQLRIDLGEGWTVASALAHTGFWDRWQAERWTAMLGGSWAAQDESVIAAEHLANDALHPYWAGIDAQDVPAIALEAATRLDALIASAPNSLIDELLSGTSAYMVNRFRHRGEHLDHIERSIAVAGEPVDQSFIEKNAASRRRLASLVERLREPDMTLITEEGGWTIAQVLGHVAFWDRSMETRWRVAEREAGDGSRIAPQGIPGELTDAINIPLADLFSKWSSAIGPEIGREAVAASESLDGLVAQLADRLPPSVAAGRPSLIHRWMHRDSHLDQVELALAAGRPDAAPVDRSYVGRNEASLARLRGVFAGLSAADLARSALDGDWTVGQILGHLTFWDRFLAARWRAALASGTGGQPTYLPHELADLVNDGLPPTWKAFASGGGNGVFAEALTAAEEVDGIIAGLPESSPIEAILVERPTLLDRSIHRLEHIGEIERMLSK